MTHLKCGTHDDYDLFDNRRGNALFLILIAVALFAALSYAVTNSGRGGGGIDREKAALDASSLVQATTMVRVAADRMLLFGDTTKAAFQLNDLVDVANPCTTGPNCVFSADGGGADVPNYPSTLTAGTLSANYYNTGSGLSIFNMGTTATDAFITVEPLTEAACRDINENLGISGIPEEPDTDSVLGEAVTGGKHAACIDYDPTANGYYMFYHTIVEN
tara:strand:+ start:3875 stop:4528 length:654 start_codon:yes stop_codon:yes gene_type:complete